MKYTLYDASNVYSVLRTLLLRVGSEGRLGTWVRSDLWKLVCSTHLSYIFIRTRYTWAPIYVLLKLPTQYKLVMPTRQFKAMWKSSQIGRRLQVCPCWLLTSNIIFVHSTSSLFRLLSTPKLLRSSTISRFHLHLEMSYTAMPRRWGVMATIMLTNITAFLINTCYFSVAPFAAKFFDVNETEFDLLILVNLLILPPFMLVAVFVAERCGLKV